MSLAITHGLNTGPQSLVPDRIIKVEKEQVMQPVEDNTTSEYQKFWKSPCAQKLVQLSRKQSVEDKAKEVEALRKEIGFTDLEENIDIAIQYFQGIDVDLKELNQVTGDFWDDFQEIVTLHANFIKYINKDNVGILLSHASEIKKFLKEGMPLSALNTPNIKVWGFLAVNSEKVLKDLKAKTDWQVIIQKYMPPVIQII